jgi:hypothetical protein
VQGLILNIVVEVIGKGRLKLKARWPGKGLTLFTIYKEDGI